MCNFIFVFRIISVSCTNEQRWCWNSHTISRHSWCLFLDRINTVYAGWWGCCTAYVNTEEVCRESASIHPGCTVFVAVLFDTSCILSVQGPCLCICTSWTAGVSIVLYKWFSSAQGQRGQQVQTVEFQCWRLQNLACFHLMPFYSQPNNMLCGLEYSSGNTGSMCHLYSWFIKVTWTLWSFTIHGDKRLQYQITLSSTVAHVFPVLQMLLFTGLLFSPEKLCVCDDGDIEFLFGIKLTITSVKWIST